MVVPFIKASNSGNKGSRGHISHFVNVPFGELANFGRKETKSSKNWELQMEAGMSNRRSLLNALECVYNSHRPAGKKSIDMSK